MDGILYNTIFLSLYYTFTKGISIVQFVGLDNFEEIFNNPAFILATKNTLKFIFIGFLL
ncbi:MAG: hypothetical protein TIS_02154 [Tissierella sp.]